MNDLPRENVQSYPRPPALEPVPQRIILRLGGALLRSVPRPGSLASVAIVAYGRDHDARIDVREVGFY